jgi:hypothetical protein
MREWCVITLGLGSKLLELIPGERKLRRKVNRAVLDWRRGRRKVNPMTENAISSVDPPAL